MFCKLLRKTAYETKGSPTDMFGCIKELLSKLNSFEEVVYISISFKDMVNISKKCSLLKQSICN